MAVLRQLLSPNKRSFKVSRSGDCYKRGRRRWEAHGTSLGTRSLIAKLLLSTAQSEAWQLARSSKKKKKQKKPYSHCIPSVMLKEQGKEIGGHRATLPRAVLRWDPAPWSYTAPTLATATAQARDVFGRALRMGSSRQGSGLCNSPPSDPTQAPGVRGHQCPRQLVAGGAARARDVPWLRHVLPPAGPCSCRGDRSEVAHGHIPFLRAGGHQGDSVVPRAEHLCPGSGVPQSIRLRGRTRRAAARRAADRQQDRTAARRVEAEPGTPATWPRKPKRWL